MDINKINGVNHINEAKKTTSAKPKDTEFKEEMGRDALGVQGDARNVLLGKINLKTTKPLNEAELEEKYPRRFWDPEVICQLSQEFPNEIKTLLEHKKHNGKYRFEETDFKYIKNALKKHPELFMKFAEMKDTNEQYRFRCFDILDLADKYEGNEDIIDYLLSVKTSDDEYRFGGDATSLIEPLKALPGLTQALIDNTNYYGETISGICEYIKPENEDLAIELALMKNPEGSEDEHRFDSNSLPVMVRILRQFPDVKDLVYETNSDGSYKYDSDAIDYVAPKLKAKPELKELLKYIDPYDISRFQKDDDITKKAIEYIKSGDFDGSKLNTLFSCLKCGYEATPENIEFVSTAEQKMCENIFYDTPRDFIPEILKEVKSEEREDFIKWLDLCNTRAKNAKEPRSWSDDSEHNDKKEVIRNMKFFIQNEEFRKNPSKYMELLNTMYEQYEKPLSSKLQAIFDYGKIKVEEIDDNIEMAKLISENDIFGHRNSSLGDFYVHKSNSKHPENITARNFINKYNKLKPISEKLNDLSAKDYVSIIENVSDETIQDYIDAIGDTKTLSRKNRDLVYSALTYKTEPELVEHYEKWIKMACKHFNDLSYCFNVEEVMTKAIVGMSDSPTVKLVENFMDNKDVVDTLKTGELFFGENNTLERNLQRVNPDEMLKMEDIAPDDYEAWAKYEEQQKLLLAQDLIDVTPIGYRLESLLGNQQGINYLELFANNSKEEIFTLLDKIDSLKSKAQERPDLYVNGEDLTEEEVAIEINSFFIKNQVALLKYLKIADKETVDVLMRKRLDDFDEYLQKFSELTGDNQNLLKDMFGSTNINGKPFMPTQKAEFIDLLNAYQNNHMDTNKIHEMLQTGKIDLAQLNMDLFIKIMSNAGLTDDEIASIPPEKLIGWDTKYAHLLAKGVAEADEEDSNAFRDLFRAANLTDFNEYIQDESNIYGQTNTRTKAEYAAAGLDYDKWLKPSKDLEVRFVARDKNEERLSQISDQIKEDMNALMSTPVKGFIKKQFPKLVKGDEFIIPNEYNSKAKLMELVKMLTDKSEQGQMAQVWKRAEGNAKSEDEKRAAMAKNTLTVLDHLNQRLSDIEGVTDTKVEKQRDWQIKMWDRNPQKDIFQGNYSTCCIGMGGVNESAMPHFVLDTAYNMIEVVDNNSGKTVGNALCYMIKDEDGKPAFIVDNIEINNGVKPSDEVGIQLRNAITQYAGNVAQSITGHDDTRIYMSSSYNDVPTSDLSRHKGKIDFLGNVDCESIYMDLYEGWIDTNKLNQTVELLELK